MYPASHRQVPIEVPNLSVWFSWEPEFPSSWQTGRSHPLKCFNLHRHGLPNGPGEIGKPCERGNANPGCPRGGLLGLVVWGGGLLHLPHPISMMSLAPTNGICPQRTFRGLTPCIRFPANGATIPAPTFSWGAVMAHTSSPDWQGVNP